MANLEFATAIPQQTITPGSAFTLDIHAHEIGGNNFNWTGYTPKAILLARGTTITVSGTVVSAGGGTATFTWTAEQTATLSTARWGGILCYADPTAGTQNLVIGGVSFRTAETVIP